MRIEELQSNIVALSDIRRERRRALSPFGPLNPASTTLVAQEIYRANQEARLMVLLSSLESEVATLESKYCTAYDTFNTALEEARAALSGFIQDTGGTDNEG